MLLFVVTCSALRPLFIPSRSEGPSAAQLPTSASTPTPVGYPLCFDNDPFCLSSNPFLLITIWIAYGLILETPSLVDPVPVTPAFATLTKTATGSPDFSQLGTATHRASTAPFFDSHFADSPRNAILATCLPLPIRTAQTTPASAPTASTPVPSHPPKAP